MIRSHLSIELFILTSTTLYNLIEIIPKEEDHDQNSDDNETGRCRTDILSRPWILFRDFSLAQRFELLLKGCVSGFCEPIIFRNAFPPRTGRNFAQFVECFLVLV